MVTFTLNDLIQVKADEKAIIIDNQAVAYSEGNRLYKIEGCLIVTNIRFFFLKYIRKNFLSKEVVDYKTEYEFNIKDIIKVEQSKKVKNTLIIIITDSIRDREITLGVKLKSRKFYQDLYSFLSSQNHDHRFIFDSR